MCCTYSKWLNPVMHFFFSCFSLNSSGPLWLTFFMLQSVYSESMLSKTWETFVVCSSPDAPPLVVFFPFQLLLFILNSSFVLLCHFFSPPHSFQLLLLPFWTFSTLHLPLPTSLHLPILIFYPHALPSFALCILCTSLSVIISDTRDHANILYGSLSCEIY